MTWEGLTPPYATLVADPPWPVKFVAPAGGRRARCTELPYSVMTVDQVAALPVRSLSARDARLFLWVTSQLNREGQGARVVRAWGFRVAGEIIWDKPNLGMGHFPRLCHEVLLIGVRGRADWPANLRNVRSVQRWSQLYTTNGGKTHSAKPPGSYDLIEQASSAPRVELFARQPRLGWDSWGWGYEQVGTRNGTHDH